MAEAIHRYVGKSGPPPKPSPQEARKHELTAELVSERSREIRTQRMQSELLLAKARGELIPKTVVQQQAGFLLVALRSKIMQLPATYARRILNVSDVEKARQILTTAAH
jgi:hypothetical protein